MLSQLEIKRINALKIKKYRTKYSEFIAEGDKTEKFERFNDRAMVCDLCYLELKSFHK